jgi:beta-carotene ketolase (CrtO type)
MPDVIVVGAGHNGLVCASYLLRAGFRVTVLEAREIVGGFSTTEEKITEAPGFRGTVAFDQVQTNIPRSVIGELALSRYGLRFVAPEIMYSWLAPDGRAIRFWRDEQRTCEDIKRYSRHDATAYAELTKAFADVWWMLAPYLQDHPTRPRLRSIASVLARAARTRGGLGTAARMMVSSPGAVLDECFDSEEAKAAFASFAVGSMAPLDEPGTGFVMSVLAMMHRWGVTRPVGGNGAFTQALAADVIAHGGTIRLRTPVQRIVVDDQELRGVITADGERFHADHVVAAVDPVTLCRALIAPEQLPTELERELRGIGVLRNNVSAFKADIALERRPDLPRHTPVRELLASCMMFCPTLDEVRRTTAMLPRGIIPDDLPVWLALPSVLDRTLVPDDSAGETIYLYPPAVPYDLADGEEWARAKDRVVRRALDVFEQVAPGVTASVIGWHATSPHDLELVSPVHRGALMHVDMTLAQLGPWRPTRSLSGYATPWRGVWHTGAGAHPSALLNGWSGRTTARTIIRSNSARRRILRGRSHVGIGPVPKAASRLSDASADAGRVSAREPSLL